MALDRRLINIVLLGLAFMLVFTAFQTMGNIQVSQTHHFNNKKKLRKITCIRKCEFLGSVLELGTFQVRRVGGWRNFLNS